MVTKQKLRSGPAKNCKGRVLENQSIEAARRGCKKNKEGDRRIFRITSYGRKWD